MIRQYSRLDTLLRQLDRGLRISTGATGRPGTSAPPTSTVSDEASLRQSHAALTITSGLQSGSALPRQAPSSVRQSEHVARNTDQALREITGAMARANVRPSVLSPALYGAAAAVGALTPLTGESARRALHADNRRRVVQALSEAADPQGGDPAREAVTAHCKEAIDSASAAIRNYNHPTAPHSAYEPRLSIPTKKLFDLVQSATSKLVEKL